MISYIWSSQDTLSLKRLADVTIVAMTSVSGFQKVHGNKCDRDISTHKEGKRMLGSIVIKQRRDKISPTCEY